MDFIAIRSKKHWRVAGRYARSAKSKGENFSISFFFIFAPREKYIPFYEERDDMSCFSFYFWRKEHCSLLERDFQRKLIDELGDLFPGCIVLKNDPNYCQGIPDLLVLYRNKWAALETKRGSSSTKRPNQDYYILKMDEMSFARFINPQNKEEVLRDLQRSFKTRRTTRISGS